MSVVRFFSYNLLKRFSERLLFFLLKTLLLLLIISSVSKITKQYKILNEETNSIIKRLYGEVGHLFKKIYLNDVVALLKKSA